jgi:hypothetical protein
VWQAGPVSTASLALRVLPEPLGVARLDEHAPLPAWAFSGRGIAAVLRREGELTVVCASERVPAGVRVEDGWRALEVVGPLDFALTGILAGLAGSLAAAKISLFALSTFDTDVLLVREARLGAAVAALRGAGHDVA